MVDRAGFASFVREHAQELPGQGRPLFTFFTTSDGGATWQSAGSEAPGYSDGWHFLSDGTAYRLADDHTGVLISTDSGRTSSERRF